MSYDANPPEMRKTVIAALSQIVGLPLTASRRAADMRTLQFGELRPESGGSVGQFAIHIQCPWRIDGPNGIVTGRSDLWEPVGNDPKRSDDVWDYDESPNLQDFLLDNWFAQHGSSLLVEGVDADEFGGIAVTLSSKFVLRLFPTGTRGEDWRLFRPKTGTPHLVIAGGVIESGGDGASGPSDR